MNALVKSATCPTKPRRSRMDRLIKKLFFYGNLAKQVQGQETKNKIYSIMADICHQLRPIEPEFKAVYPQLSELFDHLLNFKYIKDNHG